MRVACNLTDEGMLRELTVCVIQSMLEYTAVIWSPYWKKYTRKLERIQSPI